MLEYCRRCVPARVHVWSGAARSDWSARLSGGDILPESVGYQVHLIPGAPQAAFDGVFGGGHDNRHFRSAWTAETDSDSGRAGRSIARCSDIVSPLFRACFLADPGTDQGPSDQAHPHGSACARGGRGRVRGTGSHIETFRIPTILSCVVRRRPCLAG